MNFYLALQETVDDGDGIDISRSDLILVLIVLLIILAVVGIVFYVQRIRP